MAVLAADYKSSPGDIFIKDEHPYISLERQLMIVDVPHYFDEFSYYIYYEFYNHSNKAETVNVAFPIEIGFNNVAVDPENNVLIYRIYHNVDKTLEFLEKIPIPKEYIQGDFKVVIKDPFSIDKLIELDTIPFSFYVEQDGKQIKNLNAKAYINWGQVKDKVKSYSEYHALHGDFPEEYMPLTKIKIYIFYNLIFNPQSISKVIVKYNAPAQRTSGEGGVHISQDYLIGPGGKWKGKIKEFLVFKAYEEIREDINWKDILLFKTDYEPENNEILQFYHSHYDYDIFNVSSGYYSPAENVKIIGYSSYIPEKTKVFEYESEKNIKEVIETDFSPQRLFDKDPRTAWCTNLKKDTLRYVDVELENDVLGISIINGFLKNRFPGTEFYDGLIWLGGETPPDDWGTPFEIFGYSYFLKKSMAFANASAAKIEITGLDKNNKSIKHIIELPKIKESVFYHAGISLPKGKYRVRVLDYYKGDKYDDLCIGEIMFHKDPKDPKYVMFRYWSYKDIVKYMVKKITKSEIFVDIIEKYLSERK